jgi:hypothetical protein
VRVINRLKYEDLSNAESELANVVSYMRNKSLEYNQEHPTAEMLINDIKNLSEGAINLDEDALRKAESEHKTASSNQKAGKRQQRQRQQQKGGRKNGQRHNMQK